MYIKQHLSNNSFNTEAELKKALFVSVYRCTLEQNYIYNDKLKAKLTLSFQFFLKAYVRYFVSNFYFFTK